MPDPVQTDPASYMETVRGHPETLAVFVRRVVEEGAFQGGDVFGADVQDWAIECGILEPVTVSEPCGEACPCAEWDEFPQTCYRFTTWFQALVAEKEKSPGDADAVGAS